MFLSNFQRLIFCLIFLFVSNISSQNEPLWLRYPSISPDGKSLLFEYKGDIYKVPSGGGTAVPLTLSESYEYAPVWSHDGASIAFASDRFGNFDVFKMPAGGGEGTRLTFHSNNEVPSTFTVDDQNIVFSAVRQDLHTNVQFPSGVMAELYSVPANGGQVKQIITSPAHDATFSSDGKKLIFHDRKGYENEWRKHHTSAVTRDIWIYDMINKSYQQLSKFKGEDRNPVFTTDNDTFYYLSEENGSFNIFESSLTNHNSTKALTTFTKHPVRFLTRSTNNILAFSYDGQLYTMIPGEQPKKVSVSIAYDGRVSLPSIMSVNKGITEVCLSPNGKEIAYALRGELFVSSVDHGTTKRITNTPWQERSVSFSPDGRSLVYAAEKDNSWNIYTKTIKREEEPYFYTSTLLDEKTVLATDKEEFQPSFSPDGSEIAFLEDRQILRVVNLKSGETRTILPHKYNYSYSDGDQWYQWSPDGKWFLVNYGSPNFIFSPEVGLIEASGKGELRNLTLSGYPDVNPKWAMDGQMMIWISAREGKKTESLGFAEGDVYAMFFTKEAFDRFNLSEEDFELLKEREEKLKKEDAEEKESSKNKSKGKKTPDTLKMLKFDWDHLTDRKVTLTINTSNLGDFIVSKEGDKLYYTTVFEDKNNLWVTDLRTKETKVLTRLGADRTELKISKDGKFLVVLADGKPMKVTLPDGKLDAITLKGEMELKTDEERAYIFDHAWRQVREKFYVEDLQGVDWNFYYTAYKRFLPHINNNYDFTEMLSEMLGELNASHTGSGYRGGLPNGDQTPSLGVLYDYTYNGKGLKIAEILNQGPLDRANVDIESGQIIEKIDGHEIDGSSDFYKFFNRKNSDLMLLSMYDPKTKKRFESSVKPFSLNQENQLLYERWVDTRRAEVERLSNGKLGYVHVRGMNDASMRTVFEEALGRHVDADALIVDTRFNGGGNLHDVLSDFLNGKKYLDIIPHGQYVGSQPWNRWNKPSIVIMGESNYSDAHLFPVAYKIKEIGKTLGMPVPGTGTFVWWETQIDPSIYFGIPMGGWKPIGGEFLENNQLEPDIRVQNRPSAMAEGRDQQLEAAVNSLLNKN